MIFDLSVEQPDSSRTGLYDILVIGTGPAGAVLVNELIAKYAGARLCVLESGRMHQSDYGNALRQTFTDKLKIKPNSRERVFGGCAKTWNGLNAPFERMCVDDRPWLNGGEWPITFEELEEYYAEAALRYRLPPPNEFQNNANGVVRASRWQELWKQGDLQPRWHNLEEKIFLQMMPVERFALEWPDLFETEFVDLYLDASVKRFTYQSNANTDSEIEGVVVLNSRNQEFVFAANKYVLCAGGIENARILLNSKDNNGVAVGNEQNQVGRYLMNHPKRYQGIVNLTTPVRYLPYYFGCIWNGYSVYAGIRLTDEVQKNTETVSAYLRLEPMFPWTDNQGVEALIHLVKKFHTGLNAWIGLHGGRVVDLRSYAETGDATELDRKSASTQMLLRLILSNLGMVLRYVWHRVFRRPLIRRIRLRTFMEMEPSPDNRVTLSDNYDSHGYALPRVSYAPTERDRRSVELLTREFGKEIERNGIGAIADPFSVDGEFYESINRYPGFDASHHIGTTRMGASPRDSVVDSTLRVHGVRNLYVAGSSVFPTSGLANPTYTIVALSIRLAEHLAAIGKEVSNE